MFKFWTCFHSFNLYKKFVLICWVEFVWLRLINNKQESVSSLRLRMTFSTLMRFTQLSALLYCQTCHYFSGSCRDNVGNWASCFHQCTTVLPNNIDSSSNFLDESDILYPPNLAKNFDNCRSLEALNILLSVYLVYSLYLPGPPLTPSQVRRMSELSSLSVTVQERDFKMRPVSPNTSGPGSLDMLFEEGKGKDQT